MVFWFKPFSFYDFDVVSHSLVIAATVGVGTPEPLTKNAMLHEKYKMIYKAWFPLEEKLRLCALTCDYVR